MIAGAAQADVGCLVISARKGEFETGFDRGGQTREHAMLAKTLGVDKLVVVVNKMDDHTVKWSEERFNECVTKLRPFLKGCGYKVKLDVSFVPISGLTGANVKDRMYKGEDPCPWYKGKTLLGQLDVLEILGRDRKKPVRIPVLDRQIEQGKTMVLGKVEAGCLRIGQKALIQPTGAEITISNIFINEVSVKTAKPGENVKMQVKGLSQLDEIQKGYVICPKDPKLNCTGSHKFLCQLALVDLLEHKPIFTSGYKAIMHIHTAAEECTVTKLVEEFSRVKGKPNTKKPRFAREGSTILCEITTTHKTCAETFDDFPQMGRFTLRDEGTSIAIGKILKVALPKKA